MKLNEKIIRVWNEADEIREDMALSDEEIISVLPTIRSRVKIICDLLDGEFTNEEYSQIFGEGI